MIPLKYYEGSSERLAHRQCGGDSEGPDEI